MASKLTFSTLTNSRSLEIKMNNILSFYEDLASSVAFNSDSDCYEIIAIEEIPDEQRVTNTKSCPQENIVTFAKPLLRSENIVDYLIEREQLQFRKITVNI